MIRTLRALKFLVVGPMIVAMLAVINLMTSPGDWWVQWPALGIGIAWFFSLLRVARDVVLLGGLAALGTLLYKHYAGRQPAGDTWGADRAAN